ncbi:GNAT family N-acetyltransferase [Streptomyces palmae]|uniref:N-acetyltransferase n=1 Tax=Streptomyces palmae TaxID=1701085 RepID=A0A4Z0GBX9_9ACTN|nr:GNAT family N-acetyltransferase [Streptomyces palmae]TGA92821.1 N-acetyltransferase [Streptomyces palmae]
MGYTIRAIQADEWQPLRELRLAALADPVARVAFNETYANAAAYEERVWRERAERSAAGDGITTFIGIADRKGSPADATAAEGQAAGRWVGMIIALVEPAEPASTVDLVSVYLLPEHRGTGLARGLFEAAIGWAWERPSPRIERVRLWVHEENPRAEAFYRKLGFARTGAMMPDPKAPSAMEVEMALPRPVPGEGTAGTGIEASNGRAGVSGPGRGSASGNAPAPGSASGPASAGPEPGPGR